MIVTIISTLIGIIVTFIICYFIPKGQIQKANQELVETEQKLRLDIKDAEQAYNNLVSQFKLEKQHQLELLNADIRQFEQEKGQKNLSFLQAEMQLKQNIANLEGQIEEKKSFIETLEKQSISNIKKLEERTYDLATVNLAQSCKELYDKYEKLESDLKLQYIDLADSEMDKFIEQDQTLSNEILAKKNLLDELIKKADAITESNRKAELAKEEKYFYCLQLSDIDIEEIQKIRSIEPYLRKTEPLNKVIWKVYYEKPYNELIGRIIGPAKKCGIYKITHINSGRCYIGQSVDIAERFRQHIKRGIGAEPQTQNKLYPAMMELGIENFMFEIVEECLPNQLTEREKYYTDVYQAQSFGYVARKG